MSASSSMPKRPSDPLDLIDLDSQLTDEEKAIRAATRQVCADVVDPHIMQWYEDGDLPARELALEFGKGLLLALHLGKLKDAGRLPAQAVSIGKLNSTREALAIARECRTILGAAGITLDYPLMRHANNLESVLTYEGTAEVHQLVIGQALTGESAFR